MRRKNNEPFLVESASRHFHLFVLIFLRALLLLLLLLLFLGS